MSLSSHVGAADVLLAFLDECVERRSMLGRVREALHAKRTARQALQAGVRGMAGRRLSLQLREQRVQREAAARHTATAAKLQGELQRGEMASKGKGLNHVHIFAAVLQICFSNTHAFLFRKMIEQLQKDEDLIRRRMAAYNRETLFENLPVLGEIAAVDVNVAFSLT